MSASEKTVVGFAKQTAQGTPNVTDASFTYMLFREGGLATANMNVPLDPEVGGGAMDRNVIKAGVVPGGALSFIPRPKSLGTILMGLLGKDTATPVAGATGAILHSFTHDTDQFAVPWFTGRQAPAQQWGEQYPDLRFSSLVLSWRAARFLEGEVSLVGAGVPGKVATTTWSPYTYVDGGPQFIAPLGKIDLPTGTSMQVLSGAFAMQLAQPIDDKMVVGSYSPVTLDVVHRSYVISLVCRLQDDDVLYNKMTLDPAGGDAWVADLLKEADIALEFASYAKVGTGAPVPYNLAIKANGESGATANIIWTARPLSIRAGRQITMAITGTFVASTVVAEPITIELTNDVASY